jgi:beta-galactosidase
VLEPAFHWANSDESTSFTKAVVCSNCDHLKFYMRKDSVEGSPWDLIAELDPDREEFNYLTYPPFILDRRKIPSSERHGWGDLRIDGYLKGKQVISKTLSGRGIDSKFMLLADDTALCADGADTTRVVMRVTDEFGNIRPYANDPIVLKFDGPAELIGDNPFALIGGTGAVWVRAKEQAGTVSLTATHPRLGSQKVEIALTTAPAEMI